MSTIGRISMKKFDATFEWKISNFLSVIKDSAKSNRIVSPRFSFSDCDWFLAAYLDSDNKWICLYLKLDSVTDCKTIVFNVNLKRVDGTDIHCGIHVSNSEKVFKKDQLAWGYEEVIEFETLKNDNALISSGTLNIECFMQECKPQKMEQLVEPITPPTAPEGMQILNVTKDGCAIVDADTMECTSSKYDVMENKVFIRNASMEVIGSLQKLPTGWVRKALIRQSGKTKGKIDIYFFSPCGKKYRSKIEIENYIYYMDAELNILHFNFNRVL